jgi:hypothetical protein
VSKVEFFTHCSLLAYFTQTKPLAPLPEVLPAAGHLVHSLTVVVGAGDEGWLFTTELEPCFTHWILLPTFLQTNFVPETTFTALTLVQLPDAWAGDPARVPKRNASTKVIEAKRLAEVNLAESAGQERLSFLEAARIKAPNLSQLVKHTDSINKPLAPGCRIKQTAGLRENVVTCGGQHTDNHSELRCCIF